MKQFLPRVPLFLAALFVPIYAAHLINESAYNHIVTSSTMVTLADVLPAIPVAAAATKPLPAAEPPKELQIPAIHATIPVIPVGVTPQGILDTPHNFVQAGWYKEGTIPGQIGSAVIDGHVDNGASIAGVFKHLSDLKTGDDIYVTTTAGTLIHFQVTQMNVYPRTEVPMDKIVHEDDAPYLRIITCNGRYIAKDHTYNKRLVVTATLVR